MTPQQAGRWHRVQLPSGATVLLIPGPWLWDGNRMFNCAAAEIVTFDGHLYRIRAFDKDGGYADSAGSYTEQEAVDDAETTLRHMGWTITLWGITIGPTLDNQEKTND